VTGARDRPVAVRLSPDELRLLDAEVERLRREHPEFTVTRSAAMRAIITRYLRDAEEARKR